MSMESVMKARRISIYGNIRGRIISGGYLKESSTEIFRGQLLVLQLIQIDNWLGGFPMMIIIDGLRLVNLCIMVRPKLIENNT